MAKRSAKKVAATILRGDCIELMKKMPADSVDAIVTDPPYGINLMGKTWDGAAISAAATFGEDHTKTTRRSASMHAGRYNHAVRANRDFQRWTEAWAAEAMRVLKPGGHILAFGSPRTYHRLAAGIEDAGFEVRDSIHWIYGSGFPKSMDISKAIDKQRHDRPDIYRVTAWIKERRDAVGLSNREIDDAFGFRGMAGHWTSNKQQPTVPTLDQIPKLLEVLRTDEKDIPADIKRLLFELNGRKGQPGENWLKRPVTGQHETAAGVAQWRQNYTGGNAEAKERRDVPTSEASKKWDGWGTALKPAHEPIIVARKPTNKTTVANVLEHGTGALNIDGNRIGTGTGETRTYQVSDMRGGNYGQDKEAYADREKLTYTSVSKGRWPSNLVIDGATADAIDEQAEDAARFFASFDFDEDDAWPFLYQAKPSRKERDAGLEDLPKNARKFGNQKNGDDIGDGSVNDRFTTAPSSNYHPTVKPLALMRHLVRLVTPPGGTVLDPFAGSGTTLAAGILEGFDVIGCEMTEEYIPLIKGRTEWAQKEAAKRSEQMRLLP